ncbi:MAG: ornithine carbamoyltransferase [Planctomycetota bacterium]
MTTAKSFKSARLPKLRVAARKSSFAHRHFTTLTTWSSEDFAATIKLARAMKSGRAPKAMMQALKGKIVALMFEKDSLRTRFSFEVGARKLGGSSLFASNAGVRFLEREDLRDQARVMSRYVQGLVLRTFSQQTIDTISEFAAIPVINALSDFEHPCQGLADAMTIEEHFGSLKGRKVVFIGDGFNVARSLFHVCALGGAKFVLSSPAEHKFDPDTLGPNVTDENYRWEADPARAAAGADVLYTDAWTSMGQESETVKRQKKFAGFTIDAAMLARAPQAIVMHCLPCHRGEEISEEAMEGAQSRVFDEAENRLWSQMAVMALLTQNYK